MSIRHLLPVACLSILMVASVRPLSAQNARSREETLAKEIEQANALTSRLQAKLTSLNQPAPDPAAAQAKPPELPKILDEPKTIDPATLINPKLATKATVDFTDSSLREVVTWLREKHKLVVLLDQNAIADIGVSPAEPISDRLDDDPIYLMLNRLRAMQLDWYFDDEVLHITTVEVAENRATTLPYNVGDLLDAGYEVSEMQEVIFGTVAVESWEEVGGLGVLSSLGDVLFVRHNAARQRDVSAFLSALRKHGRQTFVNDPSQHLELRSKLVENVSVDFADTPLESAVSEIGKLAKIDIRLDVPALRAVRVREREPVTLKLADRRLSTVLQAILLDLDLTWVLRNGVLWVTTPEVAEELLKTAVYDVRDLCRNGDESDALIEAITSQTDPDSWDEVGGPGSISMAKPGVMVITHTERAHSELLNLLETYRSALRASKPRKRDETDPNKLITVYYRVHAAVAKDLNIFLPLLVPADNWQKADNPEGKGEVFVLASAPDLTALGKAANSKSTEAQNSVVVERAVLVIRQTRKVHDKVEEVIRRIETGDAIGGGGGGLGGGGFGGGFFSLPPIKTPIRER